MYGINTLFTECLRLRRTYGLIIHCNDTEAAKRCRVSCRAGLYFANTPLLEYECGRVTGYKWNHQTADNPNARLPTCSGYHKIYSSLSVFHALPSMAFYNKLFRMADSCNLGMP